MYLLIVFLPLLGATLAGLFGRVLGGAGSARIAIFCLGLTTLFSYIAFYQVGLLHTQYSIELAPWIDSGALHTNWGFLFDSLTVTMLLTVTSISLVVHIYSVGYMSEDPHLPRFMAYLSLFTFFMIILVTADNFIQMFIGWEGVGLCSYLLISFWYTRIEANRAAMKAMIVNRIGDFGLILGIAGIYSVFKSVTFATVFASAHLMVGDSFIFLTREFDTLTVIALLLFIGAMGKSAQIGLHTWLPDAMEGPTPVSALIHAATMVTAGVFMIIRCSPLLEYAPTALVVITTVGALTAFFAATVGLVQNDLKKVIAYSTCSQLGYMIFSCGLSSYSVSVFHLMNHAFFKALLFLGAGCVIHAIADEQDMRRMGGLARVLPMTYIFMLVGSLSLMGFPFLTGFYSKDVILEFSFAKYTIDATFAYWLGVLSASFTAFYSFRLLFLTFLHQSNTPRSTMESVHEAPLSMSAPLFYLVFGSIFVGYLFKDAMIGLGTDFWGQSIFILPQNILTVESEFLPYYIKLLPVVWSIAGALVSLLLYSFGTTALYVVKTSAVGHTLHAFLTHKWYWDKIYNHFITRNIVTFGYRVSFKVLDRGFIELFGPYGISILVAGVIKQLSQLQTGLVYNYAFVILVGLFVLMSVHMLASGAVLWLGSPVLAVYGLVILLSTQISSGQNK